MPIQCVRNISVERLKVNIEFTRLVTFGSLRNCCKQESITKSADGCIMGVSKEFDKVKTLRVFSSLFY